MHNRQTRIARIVFGSIVSAVAAFAQPANDNCANRQNVGLGATAFDSTLATSDGTLPSCTFDGNELYFQFQPAVSGTYTIDVCGSSFDTTLSVYDGCGGAELACNDDA